MKCPWRTTNVKCREGAVIFDRTDFEDCYKNECPFWKPISYDLTSHERIYHCARTIARHMQMVRCDSYLNGGTNDTEKN